MEGGRGGREEMVRKGGVKNVSKWGSKCDVFTHSDSGSAEGDAAIDASASGSSAATRPTARKNREGMGGEVMR